MQNLSFRSNNAVFNYASLKFSMQIFTFENVYELSQETCTTIIDKPYEYSISSNSLTWGNGQEIVDGAANIHLTKLENKMTFKLSAKLNQKIRSVKLTIKDIPKGEIINFREGSTIEISNQGSNFQYPSGWRGMYTPLIVWKTDNNKFMFFRSHDNKVRDKRFVFIPNKEVFDIELIFEEDATNMTNAIVVPEWEVGECNSLEEIMSIQAEHIEKSFQLVPWKERLDVPEWMKDISLIASIHCQHWNGYIFNDYKQVLEHIRWLTNHIEPKRILVYLPGWEGRYYWEYGDYKPDERMGGEQGFSYLINSARELGVRIMPMFGMNIANPGLPNFEQWGKPSIALTPGGYRASGSVDWDSSRHYDHGSNVMLNPGAPGWQNRLVHQITSLIEKYKFDGVFLDISAAWFNDPNFNYYDGLKKLCQRIREHHKDVIIAGEGWYDAIGMATPLVQSGHTDGVLHQHDLPFSNIFSKYNRSFGHLCLGDVSRGSTGVHELGYNLNDTKTPVTEGIIPTLTIVDGTVEDAPEKVIEIIEDAKKYADLYIDNTNSSAINN